MSGVKKNVLMNQVKTHNLMTGWRFARGFLSRSCALLILLCASNAFAASAYQFSRSISDLTFASEQLARDLRGSLGYSSLRASAEWLATDAEQLQKSISYGRSHSYIRLQINDVRRRYQQLQVTVAKLREDSEAELVAQHMEKIAAIYDSLDGEHFYGNPDYGVSPLYSPYVTTAPIVVVPGEDGEGVSNSPYIREEIKRWIDVGQTVRPQTATEARQQRREFGEQTGTQQGFDHRSPVLDRQAVRRWGTQQNTVSD